MTPNADLLLKLQGPMQRAGVHRALGDQPTGDLPRAFLLCPPLFSLLSQGRHGLGCSLGLRPCCLVALLHPLHQRMWPLRLPLLILQLLLLVQRLRGVLLLPEQCLPRSLPHSSRLLKHTPSGAHILVVVAGAEHLQHSACMRTASHAYSGD